MDAGGEESVYDQADVDEDLEDDRPWYRRHAGLLVSGLLLLGGIGAAVAAGRAARGPKSPRAKASA